MLEIRAFHHMGIRVVNLERSLDFYAKLGFEQVYVDGEEPVAIVKNAAGVEINLIHNAADDFDGDNVLMDVPTKHPGHTHVALRVDSIDAARAALNAAGIELSGGPTRLGAGTSMFIRDPDRTVIELRADD